MSLFLAALGGLGIAFGRLGQNKAHSNGSPPAPTTNYTATYISMCQY